MKHGQNGRGDSDWPQQLAEEIRVNVDTAVWAVDWYDWATDAATVSDGMLAMQRAIVHGRNLGESLADHAWDHVHLVAHDAGAWLRLYRSGRQVQRRLVTRAMLHSMSMELA